ncbi:MmcQ/YjbR family DNA-binding protein [Zeaxanthinibacter sp. PT1]|uniref:MmcQ/YjbR family DNA-binding protein n=1 Tax=Zeaxanthinibacter TaxID=561554 RepID=UPI002348F9B2|nr:MmcQ/YjbR family DNA-binding protein [Zeaxanthinibacter sp. PT1]MDC6350247.1 MmcQ/YjbR family DNA-binding protein [Zeaxanthinibacter sp. PT1]
MNIESFREYCICKKGVTEELPFDEHTLVFKVMGKIFVFTPLERSPPQVNMKCDPERAIDLRDRHAGIIPALAYLDKRHWNTLYLDQLPTQLLEELIDHSYDLVVNKLTRKQKDELFGL